MKTLAERIKEAEALGFKLKGFYCAPDVWHRAKREIDAMQRGEKVKAGSDFEQLVELCFPLGSLKVTPTELLPPGHIAPDFELPKENLGAFPLLVCGAKHYIDQSYKLPDIVEECALPRGHGGPKHIAANGSWWMVR